MMRTFMPAATLPENTRPNAKKRPLSDLHTAHGDDHQTRLLLLSTLCQECFFYFYFDKLIQAPTVPASAKLSHLEAQPAPGPKKLFLSATHEGIILEM